ncbi:shikimate dehydrogenase [Aestuariirhabdus sp. LZHN29]|uniref:shikimate dehydrogenase n=1 Tax=Aestuariirhabdus sp. LZHN29 TaxID=3417462 RepID=UPI003CECED43
MSPMDRYAVMGNPVAHSKSPQIHRDFAEQTGQAMEYQALKVDEGDFEDAVKRFFVGGQGLNITVPFKERAWHYAGRLTERAQRAGAVNTLWQDADGALVGDNTDGCGLVTDLKVNQKVRLEGGRILLLGAGGAARGVIQPLLAENPASLVIANRTLARAQELVVLFAGSGALQAVPFDQLSGEFDLVVNATSASLHGEIPPLPETSIGEKTICYDMMYGADPTAFNRWASALGARRCIDGLGMLVEQAAEAFYCWRGVRPATEPVLRSLRSQLDAR